MFITYSAAKILSTSAANKVGGTLGEGNSSVPSGGLPGSLL